MKPFAFVLSLVLILLLAVPVAQAATPLASIPTFDIVSVDVDNTVTVKTHNFPSGKTFDVTMNYFGTLGLGGVKVKSVDSGAGGTINFTFDIPASLKGTAKLAIRMDSTTGGYFAYNWFDNKPGGTTPPTGGPVVTPVKPITGIPTFAIVSVEKDSKVTIKTSNFPAGDKFDVLMGKFGTLGVGGTKVDSVDSGSGGALTFTFNIPDGLKGQANIAIRLQSPTSGYYSYNWFPNATGSGSTPVPPSSTPSAPIVYPSFTITAVVKDGTVTIKTANLKASDKYDVYLGKYGTQGVGGVKVTTVDSGTGGTQTYTVDIPASLKGEAKIAIRLQSPTTGFYAFNWFYNSTYP